MKVLNKFAKIVEFINTWLGKVLLWSIVPIAGVSLYEIISRYFFNKPTLWASQILSNLFYLAVVPCIGYVLQEDGHVRMDVLYARWSQRQKTIVEISTFIIFLIFIVLLSYELINMAWTSTITNERVWAPFRGPIYPKKISLALGALLLLFAGFAKLIRNIQYLVNIKKVVK
jgi:TRAP-type mannitol/chloroaromatic compound transport system permease small subunit